MKSLVTSFLMFALCAASDYSHAQGEVTRAAKGQGLAAHGNLAKLAGKTVRFCHKIRAQMPDLELQVDAEGRRAIVSEVLSERTLRTRSGEIREIEASNRTTEPGYLTKYCQVANRLSLFGSILKEKRIEKCMANQISTIAFYPSDNSRDLFLFTTARPDQVLMLHAESGDVSNCYKDTSCVNDRLWSQHPQLGVIERYLEPAMSTENCQLSAETYGN